MFDDGQNDNASIRIINNREIEITGNGWYCLDLDSIAISPDTMLSLDFSNEIEGEIHGVGFDTDQTVSAESMVQFAGSQAWADFNLDDYDTERPNVKHYDIPIGQYFTGTFQYLVIAHDDDSNKNAVASYANLRIYTPTPTTSWADAMGLDIFGEYGLDGDANDDGKTNAYHFGLATNPLSANHQQNDRIHTAANQESNSEYLTLTAPFRLGATFSGNPLASAPVDGVIYTIYGDSDMLAPLSDLTVEEVTPALDTGLPALEDLDDTPGADWEYRSFRIASPLTDAPGFLWIDVSEAP